MADLSKEFCVYITLYSGNKLPPFYIGYTTTNNVIVNGYHGTVTSKKYKLLWKSELKDNPQLFDTLIISTHDTDFDAKSKEYRLQKQLKVVQNPLYINLAYSNGTFGGSKENHPRFGQKLSEESKNKISRTKLANNIKFSDETRKQMSTDRMGRKSGFSGKNHSNTSKEKISKKTIGNNNPNFGKKHTIESLEKISKTSKGKVACYDPDGNIIYITTEIFQLSNGFYATCRSKEGQTRKLNSQNRS